MKIVKLRYDGKYEAWDPVLGDPRQWTVLSSFIDADGAERKGGSFHLESLVRLGIVPAKTLQGAK